MLVMMMPIATLTNCNVKLILEEEGEQRLVSSSTVACVSIVDQVQAHNNSLLAV